MTTEEKIKTEKIKFLHNEFYASAYSAAVARARVYDAVNKKKPEFANNLASFKKEAKPEVIKMAENYGVVVSEGDHVKNIENLSDKFGELSRKYGGVFEDNHFRFGSAQKLLNLYLKYLWVAGEIPPPPHCPFDRIVIHDIMAKCFGRKGNREVRDKLLAVKWTKLDWIEDKDGELGYSSLVKYAKKCNDDDNKYPSLSEWELIEWSKLNP